MLALIKSITKEEWRFWAKALVAILILTSLSRLFVIINTPSGSIWTGRMLYSPYDRAVYLSYIEQVKDGAYFLEDLFTAPEESRPMLNFFWLGAGLLARSAGWGANFTIEFLRLLLTPFLLFVLYLLICYFVDSAFQKKLVFLLASFGGGLGAMFYSILAPLFPVEIINYNLPIDISAPEAFVYTTIHYSPHFIFSLFLFITIILLWLLALKNKKLIYVLPAGFSGLILANFHPFSFAAVFFILTAYTLFSFYKNRQEFLFFLKFGLIFLLISLPSILYHFLMFKTPWWQNQAWQSGTEIPHPAFILSGFGLLLVCGLLSLFLEYKGKIKIKNFYFLLVWLIAQSSLIFFPISVQRRFLEGLAVPLSVLSSYFVLIFLEKRNWILKGKIFAATSFILLFSWSFIFFMILEFKTIIETKQEYIYIFKERFFAIKELKNIAKKSDIILTDIFNANIIPGIAARRVFVGHGVETIDYEGKYKILQDFMRSRASEERAAILKNNGIDYVFYDDGWRKDWGWNLDDEPALLKLYQRGVYAIYRVK